jgi:signal transduction histidine kinase
MLSLIVLWLVLPPLIPLASATQTAPVVLRAANPAAVVWLLAALGVTAGVLALGGWFVRGSALRGWRRRALVALSALLLLVLWAVIPHLLGVNFNSEPAILIRAASPVAFGWFAFAISATALACVLVGQMMHSRYAERTHFAQVMSIAQEQLDAGIALFDRDQQPLWINMSGRFYMFHSGKLNDGVAKLLSRTAETKRLSSQSFSIDEKLRVNVQAMPMPNEQVSVITRVLPQTDVEQNNFYERYIRRIVHDMRNPLAAIIAHAGNLAATPPSEGAVWQGTARTIEHEALRLTRLVDSILFDARLSYVPLNLERLDLADVIEEVMFQQDERAMRDGKAIEVEVPPEPAPIEADRDLLVRAISNLVDNSLKYSKHGATVRLVLEPTGAVYKLLVIDTGEGIPSEFLPHKIFEPMVRARKDNGGSGLGLAIVKKIIDLHGGTIAVQSKLGEGTTMIITLKRRQ